MNGGYMIGGKMMNGENIIHRYMINGGGGGHDIWKYDRRNGKGW